MSLSKSAGLLAGTAALSLAGGSLAGTGADADRNQELESRLAAAEAKIAQLTQAQNSEWLTEQRAGEIRSIVQDVLADADTRASLLSQGITAGYDGGGVLGSADGNFMLRINFLMQTRATWNNLSQGTGSSTDENRFGFDNPRNKLILTGNLVSPDWTFRFDHNWGSNEDGFREGVGNAWLAYNYGEGWSVKMGTMKTPFLREELVESQHQLAMERSVTNYTFTGGYTDGIAVSYDADQFGVDLAYTDGIDEGNTEWGDEDTEYAFTVRAEFLAMGTWDQFMDFTSPQGSEQGLLIGGGIHFEEEEYGSGNDDELAVLAFTIDGSFEGDGWNAFAAYIYTDLDDDNGTDFNTNAIVLQGGLYFTEDLEGYIRYEWADFDDLGSSVLDVEDLSILTIGVNKYFAGHNAKWTTEILIGLEELDATALDDEHAEIVGLREDDADEDGQFALRTQFQILF